MTMRYAICLLAASIFVPSVHADAPLSIRNAKVELREGTSPGAALDEMKRARESAWVGWSVPAVAEAAGTCCFSSNFKSRGCSLATKENSWGTSSDEDRSGPGEIYVLVEAAGGTPSRLRIVSPTCDVDGASRRLVWLGRADAGASITALTRLVESSGDRNGVEDPALAAIAYHKDARADAVLEKRALDASLSKSARQQAIFWAGNARGEAGYRLLERILASEPSGALREHAVFALTQTHVPGAVDRIKRVAVEDRNRDVRAQALFWLAQTKSEGAGDWILARLDAEEDEHVREQAVFALSQLPDGTDRLLAVLKSKRDLETIRRALFWLGQSDDPRALQEIEKILDK
jgi:hypothetical protein